VAVRAEPALLERDVERDELAAALASAQEGSGRLVVIEGDAGIGKTRLLRTARELAEETGLHVLAARATELEAEFPFAVVRQLFEPTLARAGSERRAELLGGAARRAARVVGIELDHESADAPPALTDPSFATLNALYWLVSNLAEPQPMLLAIDDVHWADVASQRFLRFLAPRLIDLPVVLVCAARPTQPGTTAEPLAALGADPAARVLRLRLLTAAAVTELVRSILGAGAHEDFCLACAEVTGGNPFLVRELLIEMTAEGIAGARDDARRVRTIAPPSVSRAVLARLARAPAPARARDRKSVV